MFNSLGHSIPLKLFICLVCFLFTCMHFLFVSQSPTVRHAFLPHVRGRWLRDEPVRTFAWEAREWLHFIIEFKLPHGAGKYAISEQKALVISSAPAIQKSVKLWLPFVPSFLFWPVLPFRKRPGMVFSFVAELADYHVIDFRQIHWLRGKITLTCCGSAALTLWFCCLYERSTCNYFGRNV